MNPQKYNRAILLRIAVLLLLISANTSASAQYFSNRYTLNRLYGFVSSLVVVDDTVYAMFTSRDTALNKPIAAFAKFDKNGNLLSTQYFDIPSKPFIATGTNTLIRSRDGGFAYGGFTEDTLGTENSLLILKYDRFGNFQWYNEIYDTNYLYLLPQVFTQDSFSNYYFSGLLTQKVSGDHDMYIAKTDSLGNLMYLKVFVDPTLEDAGLGFCINQKGHIVLGGSGVNTSTLNGYSKTYELDTGGNIIKYFKDPDSNGPGTANIIALADGGYMIASEYTCYKSQNVVGGIGCIEKLDSDFNVVWRTDTGVCSINNAFLNLIKVSDGNYIATGVAYNDTILDTNPMNGIIVKITETGQLLWLREYRGLSNYTNSDDNELNTVGFLANGDIIVGGEALDWSDTSHPQQGWLMRLDSTGCLPDSNRCGLLPDGINNITRSPGQLLVYPNPASDRITIDYTSSTSPTTITIYNLLGQPLYESTMSSATPLSVDVHSWPPGLYYIRLQSPDGTTAVRTLVKE